jgi:hypothetical protein
MEREFYKGRINDKVKMAYKDLDNIYFTYNMAELEGVNELKQIILEIKDCCANKPGNKSPNCSQCESNMIESYFAYSGFQIIELNTTISTLNNLKNDVVLDYSDAQISIAGIQNFTGNLLQTEVNIMNQLIPIKLIVTSNMTFCNIELDSIKSYYSTDDTFICWIHFGTDDTYLRVFFNGDSDYIELETQNMINDIYCTFYKLIEYENQECQEFANFQDGVSPIYLNFVFQDYTSTGPFAKRYFSETSSYSSFNKLLLSKKNYTIYIHTFNVGSIRFNGATDNPIEMMDAFNSAKGEVNIFMTFDEFTNQKAASGSNEVIRDINNDDAAKMFQMGKPVMFIGIADQLLFPLKNLFSGQSENDQSNWKVIDLAILQTSETVLHECLAHCEKRV